MKGIPPLVEMLKSRNPMVHGTAANTVWALCIKNGKY